MGDMADMVNDMSIDPDLGEATMAEFCKQCSREAMGEDWPDDDLAGLVSEDEVKRGLGAVVLCEGCGLIRVDHEGVRIDD
jgi:hypothetical protein